MEGFNGFCLGLVQAWLDRNFIDIKVSRAGELMLVPVLSSWLCICGRMMMPGRQSLPCILNAWCSSLANVNCDEENNILGVPYFLMNPYV